MKKILSLLLTVSLTFSCVVLLSSCNDETKSLQPDISQSAKNSPESKTQMELCEKIEKSLSVNEIDKAVSLSSQLVKPLNAEEKSVIMEALIQRVNNRMNFFAKSFGSKQTLISNDILTEIGKYQTIVDNVEITDSDNTNIVDYLERVSALKVYSKYNDYWAYYYAITDDLNSANLYWSYACDSYSDYMKNQHLTKSLNHFKTCLSRTYDYNSTSFGIKEARDFLQIYVDKINYYFNTGKDLSIDYVKVSKYENATEEFSSKTTEFVKKIEALPTSVYYD